MSHWIRIVLSFVCFNLFLKLSFSSDTNTKEEEKKPLNSNRPGEDGFEGENDEGPLPELTEAELRKIVAEQAIDDPLNGFYDPYEPYRLSTYAYFNPITFPKEHENPPVPVGFLPPNAPPKSLPSDFFHYNDEAHRLVLGEHAASFCPFVRRWREKHPLKPYPVDDNFLERHPPIKFDPVIGYVIDGQQKHLNDISRKAEEELFEQYVQDLEQEMMESGIVDEFGSVEKGTRKETISYSTDTDALRSPVVKWKEFMKIVKEIMSRRADCSSLTKFTEPNTTISLYGSSTLTCMQEAIILLDKWEDEHLNITVEEEIPEFVDKAEKYRQVLLVKTQKAQKEGKCPFKFFNSGDKKKKAKTGSKTKKTSKQSSSKPTALFKSSVPKWAELSPDEQFLSSEDEIISTRVRIYRFLYKQVSFPSIQKTLKKFACI